MTNSTGGEAASGASPRTDPIGLRLIVGYKLVKAATELLLGAGLLLLGSTGAAEDFRAIALYFRHHAVAAWSIALAERMLATATGRYVLIVALASLLDGVISSIEGWALYRQYRWGRWLVVFATSGLLPFEVLALSRHLSAGRIALLLVNVLIVIYLVRRRGLRPRR